MVLLVPFFLESLVMVMVVVVELEKDQVLLVLVELEKAQVLLVVQQVQAPCQHSS
jgi:hypothetical protein